MGFLIGLAGLAVGVFGFWLDFETNPIPLAPYTFSSGYFDLGAVGMLVATLGFLIQMFSYAIKRTPKAGLVRAKT